MLKKIGNEINTDGAVTRIETAGFPVPFESTLEFNAPAHGVWNIVHTGMLIPESHQIYICSPNCMRGVVLTAAEMNALDRFSQVLIEEKDVLNGNVEQLTIDGVSDCLNKLQELPRAALIFTVCVHHFLGCDLDYIYRELERRFPAVTFVRCFMDPIMRKSGLTPDQKMRKSLYEPIQPLPVKPKTAAILGSDFALDEDSDLSVLLRRHGWKLKELPRCSTYEEYLSIGKSALFISCYPAARAGAEELAERLGRPHIYLPLTFSMDEIRENERKICRAIGLPAREQENKEQNCLRVLTSLRSQLNNTEIAIDYTFHPRPLGLARLLLDAGFNVTKIFLDVISPEENADLEYLKHNYPELLLCATVNPKCRLLHEADERSLPPHEQTLRTDCRTLALGQKAAWFTGNRHFANIVEGAGWYGFNGIEKLAAAMEEAFKTEKEPRDLITAKGLGCESCIL